MAQWSIAVFAVDEIDWAILREFWRNCRISYRELAKRVGLSTTAAMNRVAAMQEDGTLMGFGVSPSNAMIGAEHYFVVIHTDASENIEEFVGEVGALPETIVVGELASTRGRSYVATGQYIGSTRLQEIGRILRGLHGVEEVELHPMRRIMRSDGGKMDLTRHHLLVLRSLTKDARMPVNEIAEETELTRRRVRKILHGLTETGAFIFGARVNFTKKRLTELAIRIHYGDYDSSRRTFDEWRLNTAQTGLIDVYYSVTEPVALAWFLVKDIREVDRVSKKLAKETFVLSSNPMVLQSMWKFPWLSKFKMDEMLEGLDD
jgi:DNA-binding Lrp family transcriptional regulator